MASSDYTGDVLERKRLFDARNARQQINPNARAQIGAVGPDPALAERAASQQATLRSNIAASGQPAALPAPQPAAAQPARTPYSFGRAVGEAVKPITDRLPAYNPQGIGKAVAGAVKAAPAVLGTAAGVAAPFAENIDLYGDNSAMSTGQKAKMFLRDAVRGIGGVATGAVGAGVGSLAGPAGSIAGGVGGYMLGKEAFDGVAGNVRQGLNWVNGKLGGDPNYHTSVDQDIAQARAVMSPGNYPGRGTRNEAPATPSQTPTQARAPAIPAGNSQAGAGRGFVNPAPVKPAPTARPAGPTARAASMAPAPVAAAPVVQAAPAAIDQPAAPRAPRQVGASGVKMAYMGSDPSQFMAQMADGTVVRGAEAMPLVNAYLEEQAAQPQDNTPFEPIPMRTAQGKIAGYNIAYGAPAIEQGLRGEALRTAPASTMAGGQQAQDAYLDAARQGAIDARSPTDAKTRSETAVENVRGENRLAEQGLQNEGSARSASISAGPGYAGVKQRADEADKRLTLDRENGRFRTVRTGTEMQPDGFGGFVAVPIYDTIDSRTGQSAAKPAAAPGGGKDINTDPKAAAIKADTKMSLAEKKAALAALGYK